MKKVLLVILDGFGLRENSDFNAIAQANTPNLKNYRQNYAFTELNASDQFVGLPQGQFGNSEVGHLNLGAGRIVRQDITRIDHALETGEFYRNRAFLDACAASSTHTIHIMGLVSDGGVHAHINHIQQLVKVAASDPNIKTIWVHAFLDGRDTPPQSALGYLTRLQQFIVDYPQAHLASAAGRYYAMDRDKRWERVELAYQAITAGQGEAVTTIEELISKNYGQNIYDEFIKPAVFPGYPGMQTGDSVIFANFRADRAIQLTQALISEQFTGFARNNLQLAQLVTMTHYNDQFSCPIAFPPMTLPNTLGEYISQHHLAQLRIAETEKYPHITYFFNGGEEQPFALEERILIASPKEVATYDLKPEMSLPEVARQLVQAIHSDKYALIVTNFANGDMVGHTGNFAASIKAVEALDYYVGEVVTAMQKMGGEVLIVADHGNCEQMYDYTAKQPHTQHTTNLVPCIYIGRQAHLRSGGALQDVAPTLLAMMGLAQPQEMTGTSLISFK